MATSNAERQALHRKNQAERFEQVSLELAKTAEENRALRAQIEELSQRLATREAAHTKKVTGLEKRLLNALEKLNK